MMLPKLLPDVDRVIYADADTIFCNDLAEAAMIDLGNNLIAGVREHNLHYINSGFMIMDLKKIRSEKIYEKWIQAAETKAYKYPDQDIINNVCKGRIMFLPPKYNFTMWTGFNTGDKAAYPDRDFSDLKYHTVVIHWAGGKKPWKDERPPFSDIWWHYARQTGLF